MDAVQIVIDRTESAKRFDSEASANAPGADRFALIREAYRVCDAEIRAGRYDPYVVDWDRVFTPIERAAWSMIRATGMPLYPQYPVDDYMLDFGDPLQRVAIECDGAAFHVDIERDRRRDVRLAEAGWHTFRVTGSEVLARTAVTNFPGDIFPDVPPWVCDKWLNRTAEGVIAAIGAVYYGRRSPHFTISEAVACLDRHRLASFTIKPGHQPCPIESSAMSF